MILCHTFPSRWKDLNQYKLLIIQTARRSADKSWLNYDIAFRKETAATGSTDWSRMNPDLYNFHTRSPATTSAASGSSTASALSLAEPPTSLDNPLSSQYCHFWNDGRCRWPFGRCRFRHSCESCNGDHPRIHCPHRPARRARSRLPSQSKGVTTIAMPPLLANSAVYSSDSVLMVIFQRLSCVLLWFYLLSSRVCQVLVICCVLRPFVRLDRFLSLLPLTWIDSSMNSAIILTQTKLHTWSMAFVMVFTWASIPVLP